MGTETEAGGADLGSSGECGLAVALLALADDCTSCLVALAVSLASASAAVASPNGTGEVKFVVN